MDATKSTLQRCTASSVRASTSAPARDPALPATAKLAAAIAERPATARLGDRTCSPAAHADGARTTSPPAITAPPMTSSRVGLPRRRSCDGPFIVLGRSHRICHGDRCGDAAMLGEYAWRRPRSGARSSTTRLRQPIPQDRRRQSTAGRAGAATSSSRRATARSGTPTIGARTDRRTANSISDQTGRARPSFAPFRMQLAATAPCRGAASRGGDSP